MKILHVADLHLGKRIAGYSLLEDQKYFLDETIKFMDNQDIKHIIIAGDIYDTTTPSGETFALFNEFLTHLKEHDIKAFIISGNHDSNEKVGYAKEFLKLSNVYVNADIKDAVKPIEVDGINYYLIPNVKKSDINIAFNQNFDSLEEAMAYMVSEMHLDKNKINIGVAHQLILNSHNQVELGGSEEPIIGTLSNISMDIFKDFDYVALGHIHKPQNIADNMRYSGSPLAYHVDEAKYEKSYTIVNIENDIVAVSTEKIKPLREVVEIKDTFDNIINNYPQYKSCFVYAIITDKEVENAMSILKNTYDHTLSLRYETHETKGVDLTYKLEHIETISHEDLFEKLFKEQTGQELTDYQKETIHTLLNKGSNE